MISYRISPTVLILIGLVFFLQTVPAYGQETLPTFVEIGQAAGLNIVGHGRGSAWADLDGDGLEDFGLGLMRGGTDVPGGFWYYKNLGNFHFEQRREAAGLVIDETIYGVTFPDVDNDGDSDVFVNGGGYQSFDSRPEVNRLFLNDGSGHFTEVPDAGGLALLGYNFTSAWDDVNRDGLLDVFICRLQEDGYTPDRRLFLNQGDAVFIDGTAAAGLSSLVVDSHQALFFDMDNDGDPDLALANRDRRVSFEEPAWTPNQLYRNEGDGTFVDVSDISGISTGFAGFVAEVSDYDRDGDLDLFMGAYNNQVHGVFVPNAHDCLYRNEGQGQFVEVAEEAGVAVVGGSMGARFWDMDNDGFPDLYVSKGGAEPNRVEYDLVFRNQGDGTFAEVGQQIGVHNRTGGHGTTACDADYDGDLDLLVPSGSMLPGTEARSLLFENQGPTGASVAVIPQGESGNKDAVGARIALRYGDVRTVGQVTAGSGYSGMTPAMAWFGVGDATVLDEVTVVWRSGVRRTGRDIPVVSRLVALLPVEFELLTPEIGPVSPEENAAPVRILWEDPRQSGQGRFEIRVTGEVEGVSLPIVAETDIPEFETDLPPGTYDYSVRLLDDLGEVFKATPEQQELMVEALVPVEVISEVHGTSSQEGIEITWWTMAEDRASLILVERMRQDDLGFEELHRMLPVAGLSSYLDAGVVAGETYSYRLVAIGRTGDRSNFGPISVTAGSVVPAFLLRSGHPNPFSVSTRLQFSLRERASVTLSIFDAAGRRVRTVDLGERPAGAHSVIWNGRNQSGKPVPAGVYYVSLRAGASHATSRLVRIDR